MITHDQLDHVEQAFGMNTPARLVALELGLPADEVQRLYRQLAKGVDIHRLGGFKRESRLPSLDKSAAASFEQVAQTVLAAIADLQSELQPMLDGELHTDECRRHVLHAKAAINDARAALRMRAALAGDAKSEASRASVSGL